MTKKTVTFTLDRKNKDSISTRTKIVTTKMKKREIEKYELEAWKSQNADNKKKGSLDVQKAKCGNFFFSGSNLILNKKQLKIQDFLGKRKKKCRKFNQKLRKMEVNLCSWDVTHSR